MICLTKLNGKEFFINHEMIETMEKTPDTVITLKDGKKIIALESPEDIVEKIIQHKRRIFNALPIIIKHNHNKE